MSFQRASCQSQQPLRDHYQELVDGSHAELAEAGRKMIQLVDRLEVVLRFIPTWGLTSHYQLKLLAADDPASPWFASITPPASGRFVIEYSSAYTPIVSEADSIPSAVNLVMQAMQKSGGWNFK